MDDEKAWSSDGVYEVKNIAVSPGFQRKGYGKHVLTAAQRDQWCKFSDVDYINRTLKVQRAVGKMKNDFNPKAVSKLMGHAKELTLRLLLILP